MTVYSYSRRGTGAIVPVPGLVDIPPELRDQARELVTRLNARAGWTRYQAL